MAFEQKNNSGALFKNEDKEDDEDNFPNYTGSCTIDGKKLYIGAWIKESKDGGKYMSLAFNPPKSKGQQKGGKKDHFDDIDSDVPF